MKFTLSIDVDGAAFDYSAGSEIARILRELAAKTERDGENCTANSYPLFDVNGNRVGTATTKRA